ncbi:hexosaminidase D-like [Achroia grisella]|uniref:hexosaminidase D-like n=1 Tax=Achroia grisella TaxID=688607 RepID=UPI0027D23133|nr:hexosaminidase D-like [Achroia grisella]
MRLVFAKTIFLKVKYIIIILLFVSVYIFYVTFKNNFVHNLLSTRTKQLSSVILPNIVVHLDFKGAPPKLQYLESLLPLLKSHGVNGLLLEYEDMFPYEGLLANLSAKNCYNKYELKQFIANAHRFGFEIIPLIQTFGHLEYALKLPEFMHLREVQMYPDSICPNKAASLSFIRHVLQQVVEFHKSIVPIKYIHIGCDEVYHINECQQCKKRHLSTTDLFLHHVITITKIVNDLSEKTTVLIWDDMLRHISLKEWYSIDFHQFRNIEIVYWDYESKVKVSHVNLMKYHKKFPNIWIASAFKGADGRTAIIPSEQNRLANHLSWFNFIWNYKFGGETGDTYNFKGIILTGWSRYSHMDPVCELLPTSIPSLIINLLFIKKVKEGVVYDDANHKEDVFFANYLSTDVKNSLLCNRLPSSGNDVTWSSCLFNGVELYNVLKQYIFIRTIITKGLNNDKFSSASIEYYSKLNFINMNTITDNIAWCNNSLYQLLDVEYKVSNVMKRYYKRVFILEYTGYLTFNLKNKLHNLIATLTNYKKRHIWDRGPVMFNISVLPLFS